MLKITFKYKLKASGQIRTRQIKAQSEESFKSYFKKGFSKYCELIGYTFVELGEQLKLKF